MSLAKPTIPQFGSSTPGMGSPDYVAPTGTQQTDGFDGTAGELVRGLVNWLFVQIYLFLSWLDLTRLTWQDIDGDESDEGGWARTSTIVAPTTGAGLTGTCGALKLPSFLGRRVVLVSAAHGYTASKDTYVDVDVEGTPVFAEVANGAGAPARGAGTFRCFKVVTNGTDRTSAVVLASQVVRFTQDVQALGDLGVSGDATIDGAATVGGILTVSGGTLDARAADVEGNSFQFGAATTVTRALSATRFNGTIDYGVTDLPLWAYSAGSTDPTHVDEFFVRTGVASSAAAWCKASLPEFPDGAILTACRVLADVTAGTVKAAVVRRPISSVSAGDNLSTTGATTGEALTAGAHVNALSMDAAEATRTINYALYTYELWVRAAGSATVRLYGAEVEADVTMVGV